MLVDNKFLKKNEKIIFHADYMRMLIIVCINKEKGFCFVVFLPFRTLFLVKDFCNHLFNIIQKSILDDSTLMYFKRFLTR